MPRRQAVTVRSGALGERFREHADVGQLLAAEHELGDALDLGVRRTRRVSLRNLSTTSCSLANFCSLPRGASTVSACHVPSVKWTSTRTMWRSFAPRAVIGGIVHHLDLGGERHAAGVGDHVVGELVDEHVAFGKQRRDAERQIHLRRGEALRRYGQPTWSTVACEPWTTILATSSGVNGRRAAMVRMASSVVWLLPTQE